MDGCDKASMIINTFKCNKPDHFIDFYNTVLKQPKSILEIGVQTGRSLKMWRRAFPEAMVIGLDIEEPHEPLPDSVSFIKGDHTDIKTLQSLSKYDLIVDDGSHKTGDQILLLDVLYNHHLHSGGVYVIEDLETSYRDGFKTSEETTVEHLQKWVDSLQRGGDIKRITFGEYIVAIEKP